MISDGRESFNLTYRSRFHSIRIKKIPTIIIIIDSNVSGDVISLFFLLLFAIRPFRLDGFGAVEHAKTLYNLCKHSNATRVYNIIYCITCILRTRENSSLSTCSAVLLRERAVMNFILTIGFRSRKIIMYTRD